MATDPRTSPYTQAIDLHTSHPAEVERLLSDWRRSGSAAEHVEKATVTRDQSDEGHLVLVLEFPSAAAALAPSADAHGAEAAGRLVGLLDGPPQFRDA